MPAYTFKHPKKEKYVDVVFGMNDKKFYIDEKGVEWERQFSRPQVAIDSSFANVDPWDSKAFVNKTNKRDTLGSILDRSQELHEKRGGDGNDEVKEQFYKDYAKKRSGQKHKDVKMREAQAKLASKGIVVTPD